MQPTPQTYTPASFPNSYGKAISIFKPAGQGVQTEFAFIPSSFSSTYIINVLSNTTRSLAPPPIKDAGATFAASSSAIVMLGSDGVVSWLAIAAESGTGTWQTVSTLPVVNFATSLAGSSGSASNATDGTASNSTLNSTSTSNTSGAIQLRSLVSSTLVGCGLAIWAIMSLFWSLVLILSSPFTFSLRSHQHHSFFSFGINNTLSHSLDIFHSFRSTLFPSSPLIYTLHFKNHEYTFSKSTVNTSSRAEFFLPTIIGLLSVKQSRV